MKYSILFDKLGGCKGCLHENPGPSEILSVSACTWCERNPFLFRGLRDHFEKKPEPKLTIPETLLKNDCNPALEANKTLLAEWGVSMTDKPDKEGKK